MVTHKGFFLHSGLIIIIIIIMIIIIINIIIIILLHRDFDFWHAFTLTLEAHSLE